MQREVAFNENSLLNAIERLRIAVETYNAALAELERAKKQYDEAEDAIVPEMPKLNYDRL
jgi:hypothetical protein